MQEKHTLPHSNIIIAPTLLYPISLIFSSVTSGYWVESVVVFDFIGGVGKRLPAPSFIIYLGRTAEGYYKQSLPAGLFKISADV